MTHYEHRQTGFSIIYAIGLPALIILAVVVFSPAAPPGLFLALVVLILSAILFWKLTIKIENETLRVSFGPGLIRKTIPVTDIVAVEPIRIRWWWGWGVHYTFTPYGWLYNVSGLDAVAITLRDGRRLCLGTDEPEALVKAIQDASA
jgi:hypothetical protein